jgi:signal transduction histidine kinase
MDDTAVWTLALVGYGLSGLLTAGIAGAYLWRASQSIDAAWIVSALFGLTLHYAGLSIDAAVHAGGARSAELTMWVVLGPVGVAIAFSSLTMLLLDIATRVMAPHRPPASSRYLVSAAAIGSLLLVAGESARVIRDLVVDAPAAQLQAHLSALTYGDNSFLPQLFALGTSAVFRQLFSRVPEADRAPWMRRLAQQPARPTEVQATDAVQRISGDRYRALSGVYAFTVLLVLIHGAQLLAGTYPWGAAIVVVLRLLCLPSVIAVLFYTAPSLFFEVAVKQGMLFLALSGVACISTWTAGTALAGWSSQVAAMTGLAASVAVYVGALAIVHLDAWLDRRIFHRPDYARELNALLVKMARSTDTGELGDVLARDAGNVLGAAWGRFAQQICEDADLAVGVGAPGHVRGFFSLGPRRRGHRYTSADVAFLEAVAAHYSSALEADQARTERHNATLAELRSLRAQINPHFLFNALNLLAEKVRDTPAAERVVLNLAEVFRFALESTQRDVVSLRSELATVRAYLEIQAERFGSRLRWTIDAPERLMDAEVPPMVLQPLVENAVTHGISARPEGGTVRVVASEAKGRLQLTVSDDGVGFAPATTPERVGLANVRARVAFVGGAWHLHAAPGAGTMITLEVGAQ